MTCKRARSPTEGGEEDEKVCDNNGDIVVCDKRRKCTQAEPDREEPLLPFGGPEYENKPISAIVYHDTLQGMCLAGLVVRYGLVIDEIEALATSVWANRHGLRESCTCGEQVCDEQHQTLCPGYFLGASHDETQLNIMDKASESLLPSAIRVTAWLHRREAHWPAVEALRNALKRSKLCLACGSRLVAIGDNRSRGADHTDWKGRLLHKKCWIESRRETPLAELEEFGIRRQQRRRSDGARHA